MAKLEIGDVTDPPTIKNQRLVGGLFSPIRFVIAFPDGFRSLSTIVSDP
jgi:hypothetical protein